MWWKIILTILQRSLKQPMQCSALEHLLHIMVRFVNETFPHARGAAVHNTFMHYYGPFVSGWMFVRVASVWEKLCGSRGLDNWLVLECQMAEEGIMVDSSCCHEVEVGVWRPPVKGGAQSFFFFVVFFYEWAPRLSWPPSQFSPAGVLL